MQKLVNYWSRFAKTFFRNSINKWLKSLDCLAFVQPFCTTLYLFSFFFFIVPRSFTINRIFRAFCIGLCWLQCNFRWRMCIQVSTTLWNASDFRSGWSCKFRNQRDQTVWMCSIKFDIARFLCVITLFHLCVSVCFSFEHVSTLSRLTEWANKRWKIKLRWLGCIL